MLDLCCNSGGFAVYAKVKGSADEVTGIDIDETAVALAKQNANLNQARVRIVQAEGRHPDAEPRTNLNRSADERIEPVGLHANTLRRQTRRTKR